MPAAGLLATAVGDMANATSAGGRGAAVNDKITLGLGQLSAILTSASMEAERAHLVAWRKRTTMAADLPRLQLPLDGSSSVAANEAGPKADVKADAKAKADDAKASAEATVEREAQEAKVEEDRLRTVVAAAGKRKRGAEELCETIALSAAKASNAEVEAATSEFESADNALAAAKRDLAAAQSAEKK